MFARARPVAFLVQRFRACARPGVLPFFLGVDLMKRHMRCAWLVLVCLAPLWPGIARADDPFPAPPVFTAGNNVVGGTSSRCVHNGAFVLDPPCDEFPTRLAACQAITDVFNGFVLAA